jgi:hypothetical protein
LLLLGEVAVEHAAIDRHQPRHVVERAAFVEFVRGGVGQAELADRAVRLDEARIRRAAGRAESSGGLPVTLSTASSHQGLLSGPGMREEALARDVDS